MCGRIRKRFHFYCCIFEFWINEDTSCHYALPLLFDWKRFEYAYATKSSPKHLGSQGRVGTMTKSLLLTLTWNQDATSARPWRRGQPSLLPSHSRKLAIIKKWFKLAVGRPASQFRWQCQPFVEYKLVLALDESEIIIAIVRVVASRQEAVASVQPCEVQHTK